MLKNYTEVMDKAKFMGPVTISVAVAQDKDVLEAVKAAEEAGLASAILVGDEELIKPMIEEVGLSIDTPIIHEADISQALLKAVSIVRNGEAQVLMKGLVNSSDFLRAVLNSETGLRTGRLLSHLAAFEIPGQEKIVFHTDGGINIAPNLEEKREILVNAIFALKNLGIEIPKVAILAANEKINPQMPATVDARVLVDMGEKGELPSCIIEGPIAMDVAVSPDAARHKGLDSRISGDVDLFLLPNIEAGNLVGKTLIYSARARMAGFILGTTHPVVMTSRAETAEGKLNSIALACLASGKVTVNSGKSSS